VIGRLQYISSVLLVTIATSGFIEVCLHLRVRAKVHSYTFVDYASAGSFLATSRCYGSFMFAMTCKAADTHQT
jgi:hypothetical protein